MMSLFSRALMRISFFLLFSSSLFSFWAQLFSACPQALFALDASLQQVSVLWLGNFILKPDKYQQYRAAPAFRRTRLADIAPVQDEPVMSVLEHSTLQASAFSSASSTSSGFLPGARPVSVRDPEKCACRRQSLARQRRHSCTTLAVLRPTPGNRFQRLPVGAAPCRQSSSMHHL